MGNVVFNWNWYFYTPWDNCTSITGRSAAVLVGGHSGVITISILPCAGAKLKFIRPLRCYTLRNAR